jgi:hypothetical protein
MAANLAASAGSTVLPAGRFPAVGAVSPGVKTMAGLENLGAALPLPE